MLTWTLFFITISGATCTCDGVGSSEKGKILNFQLSPVHVMAEMDFDGDKVLISGTGVDTR